MQDEELKARVTMSNLLSQHTGPQSLEQFQDHHEHQMESLGKQLKQQQDDLRRLQKERAARYAAVYNWKFYFRSFRRSC